MPADHDAMLVAISNALNARPVRWAQRVLGDYDGSERTLEVFEADAADQRRLLRDLRPLRPSLAERAGGPVVVVFHTRRETARLHAAFVAGWRGALPESRARVAASVDPWGLSPATAGAPIERAVTHALAGVTDVAAVYLFGSYARGDAGPESDVDLGVVFVERTVTPARFGTVADAVAASVARATGIERIDVVDLAAQGAIFAHNALLDGTLVFDGDRARRIDFVTDTVSRAIDFRPTYEIATHDKAGAMRRALRAEGLVGERP